MLKSKSHSYTIFQVGQSGAHLGEKGRHISKFKARLIYVMSYIARSCLGRENHL